ncbi:MAG: CAAX prenyl protease-related protein [Bryobacteraceae bacterium]
MPGWFAELRRNPSAPYVIPFAAFLLLLGAGKWIGLPDTADAVAWFFVMAAILWFCSRQVIDLRVSRPVAATLVGAGVFALWIAPDLLWPHYRGFWLFQNALTGTVQSSLSTAGLQNPLVLVFRSARAVLIVPIVEELFWRAWLMRWLISPDFQSIRLGTYAAASFWITATLFASEHGPFWDVGLATGIIYNAWMVRTKSVGDLIWTHAVTNACLCAFVILAHQWQYWL